MENPNFGPDDKMFFGEMEEPYDEVYERLLFLEKLAEYNVDPFWLRNNITSELSSFVEKE